MEFEENNEKIEGKTQGIFYSGWHFDHKLRVFFSTMSNVRFNQKSDAMHPAFRFLNHRKKTPPIRMRYCLPKINKRLYRGKLSNVQKKKRGFLGVIWILFYWM